MTSKVYTVQVPMVTAELANHLLRIFPPKKYIVGKTTPEQAAHEAGIREVVQYIVDRAYSSGIVPHATLTSAQARYEQGSLLERMLGKIKPTRK